MFSNNQTDIVIIGSDIGGSTMAAGLAPSGLNILILECGAQLPNSLANADQDKIFREQFFKPQEEWFDKDKKPFRPGNYYYVGGNSKFFGAVLARYRKEDFLEMEHEGGISPAWPVTYEEFEPWYTKAEALFKVRGDARFDPTEPYHSAPYPYKAIEDEKAIKVVKDKLIAKGLNPYPLPLAVDIEHWKKTRKVPWDAHPHFFNGKIDAETGPLTQAIQYRNVRLQTNSKVLHLKTSPTTNRIEEVIYTLNGELQSIKPKLVILSAGAIHSAALLLRSKNSQNKNGLANSSDMVGRNFMNHNCSAIIGFNHKYTNDAIYSKTFGINDFYLNDGAKGLPLGNIQLLGKVSGKILKANMPLIPSVALNYFSKHSIDFYAMSEDLPSPNNRVFVEGDKINLVWERNNWEAHQKLVRKFSNILKECGFYLVLNQPFDKRTPSHQCGTIRMGNNPKDSPLNSYCQSYDHDNLYVVDASFFPSSAAVNPALTIAAQALRVSNHILKSSL
ncbi:GMC oxidoreductase [Acinetobacter baumannii]|uniref:GMC oxidoreductase n=1 Tax=Acinetobacter baumannii TaxID=470 RepID=UPI00119DF32B|nr:GMC family oxidoreductase [Acinetobacter baumannii]MCP9174593.1 GMC family oxidoreductase [Acinetobacter baumannii]TWO52066.1 GMC family oxidoreductase [Acinetobacter baumannii]